MGRVATVGWDQRMNRLREWGDCLHRVDQHNVAPGVKSGRRGRERGVFYPVIQHALITLVCSPRDAAQTSLEQL